MSSKKNETKKNEKKQPRWQALGIGAVVFTLLMFGVGYSLGWLRTGTVPEGELSAQPGMTQTAGPGVASLGDLLPRLEAKVAAKPGDSGQRMLLAQTYVELGQHAKAVEQFRLLHKQAPHDNPTTILLATSLMQQGTPTELRESSKLLDEAVREKPAVIPMARLYQGDIQMKLGDTPGAIKIWKDYLGKMSAGDTRRAMFEDKIAQASGKP